MDKKMTFEQANEKLENTALPLAESVKCYAEACELLSFCMQELETCKGQIEDINERLERFKSDDGELL